MTALRNVLITFGACMASAQLLGLIRWGIIYPLFFGASPRENPHGALVVSIATSSVAAALAGIAAGLTVETSHPKGWSFLLAVFAWVELGGDMSWLQLPDVRSFTFSFLGTSIVCALLAVLCFFIARDWGFRRYGGTAYAR